MPEGPTYRVYTPNELQSIAPSAFRSAPPPRKSGWFGFFFVILVGAVLSGASFAALRFFKIDLDLSGGRTSLSADNPVTPLVIPPPAPPPAPVASAPPQDPALSPPSPSAKTHHKVRGIRRTSPAAPPPSSLLDIPRAPVVAPPPAPRPPSPPAPALPANPF
jgi:hypothetical protein